jgi:hypothetical protein
MLSLTKRSRFLIKDGKVVWHDIGTGNARVPWGVYPKCLSPRHQPAMSTPSDNQGGMRWDTDFHLSSGSGTSFNASFLKSRTRWKVA